MTHPRGVMRSRETRGEGEASQLKIQDDQTKPAGAPIFYFRCGLGSRTLTIDPGNINQQIMHKLEFSWPTWANRTKSFASELRKQVC